MRLTAALLAATALILPATANAWGYEGHEIVADLARAYLTPAVEAKVDAILATDTSKLTAHDMASEATWADAYRSDGHKETATWHFVDQEIDGSGDLRSACFDYPAAGVPASSGPAQDCVVDKINQFTAELAAADTPAPERLLALKYLLHFIGDVHQPLHAADNHDRGGNCVTVLVGPSRVINLHAIWDTYLVQTLGEDPAKAAAELRAHITPAQVAAWQQGDPAAWAGESLGLAKAVAYSLKTSPRCELSPAPVDMPKGYTERGQRVVALQLARAGVRLAGVLNRALGDGASAAPGAADPQARAGS